MVSSKNEKDAEYLSCAAIEHYEDYFNYSVCDSSKHANITLIINVGVLFFHLNDHRLLSFLLKELTLPQFS